MRETEAKMKENRLTAQEVKDLKLRTKNTASSPLN